VAKEMRQAHLTLIPNASHLFPEPGALLQVSKAACHWFERYLSPDIYGEEV
jgi:hypothetical protein